MLSLVQIFEKAFDWPLGIESSAGWFSLVQSAVVGLGGREGEWASSWHGSVLPELRSADTLAAPVALEMRSSSFARSF